MRRAVLSLFVSAILLGGAYSDYLSAKRKIDLIGADRASGAVLLSSRELNEYVEREVKTHVPEGLRAPKLELGEGRATGFAYVDFAKLRQASGKPLNWLVRRLLEGERPVRVSARIQSQRGTAQVDVERVEVSGMSLEGRTLEFMIDKFLRPYYPGAKVGEPFELSHGIERLEVKPAAVRVVLNAAPQPLVTRK